MSTRLAILLALARLRLRLQPSKPHGALAWRWRLGVKDDCYGYTLAVCRDANSQYVLRLVRSNGLITELSATPSLLDALRTAQLLQREYAKATRIASARDMRALANTAV